MFHFQVCTCECLVFTYPPIHLFISLSITCNRSKSFSFSLQSTCGSFFWIIVLGGAHTMVTTENWTNMKRRSFAHKTGTKAIRSESVGDSQQSDSGNGRQTNRSKLNIQPTLDTHVRTYTNRSLSLSADSQSQALSTQPIYIWLLSCSCVRAHSIHAYLKTPVSLLQLLQFALDCWRERATLFICSICCVFLRQRNA